MNTPDHLQAQPPAMAKTDDIPTRTRPIRRLSHKTIEEIARFCARGLTESEACRQLDINPRVWFNWKEKHNRKGKFADQLERLRAIRVDSLLDRIEKCADGVDMKQPDWRSAKFLLEIVDRNRFNTDKPAVEMSIGTAHIITPEDIKIIGEMLTHELAQEAKPIDCPPVKSLNEP